MQEKTLGERFFHAEHNKALAPGEEPKRRFDWNVCRGGLGLIFGGKNGLFLVVTAALIGVASWWGFSGSAAPAKHTEKPILLVLDHEALAEAIQDRYPDEEEANRVYARTLKQIAKPGVIVLNAKTVLMAPPETIIDIEKLLFDSKKPVSRAPENEKTSLTSFFQKAKESVSSFFNRIF